jgi:hypothetical protein
MPPTPTDDIADCDEREGDVETLSMEQLLELLGAAPKVDKSAGALNTNFLALMRDAPPLGGGFGTFAQFLARIRSLDQFNKLRVLLRGQAWMKGDANSAVTHQKL